MKGLISIAAVAAMALLMNIPAAAQKKNQVRLDVEDVQTIQLPKGALRIQHVVHRDRISPAGELPDPYLYVQSNFVRWAPTGLANFSFSSPTTAPVGSIGDDVVLFGGATIDPNFDTAAPVAMASEFTALLFNPGPGASSGTITLSVHPWIGTFGTGALAASHTSPAIAYTALPAGSLLLLIYEPAEPVAMTKGAFLRLNIVPDVGNPMLGWVIADSTPGNVSMMPGRGYFRRDPTLTGGSVFTGLSQGSFFMSIRGHYNFIGQMDLSTLSERARPSDPLASQLDDDPEGDPDVGIEEAMRRNYVDAELFNDTPPPPGTEPFTSRFTTFVDENGRFTLPAANEVARISMRRWDNALRVDYNRPGGGWGTLTAPTMDMQTVFFGDSDGDGDVDDADLLIVLFNFGMIE